MNKELSVFIDESGDFGEYDPRAPFYIISVILHDQSNDISHQIALLDRSLSTTELRRNFVHTGPLIRREAEYRNMTIAERRRILRRLIKFSQQVSYSHESLVVEKKHLADEVELTKKLAKQLTSFIKQNYPSLLQFDTIKIYYDNGQVGVTKIILTAFTALFENVEFKKALQKDYKMLQVADLVCTETLIKLKMKNKTLPRSERQVLGSDREINKNFLRPIEAKRCGIIRL